MDYDDFRNMSVWQRSFEMVVNIYEATKKFPDEEKFGLISDMRRAANSVTHNIAEGYGRFEKRDKSRFYKISRGSCYEIISQSLVAQELNFLSPKSTERIISQNKNIIGELNALLKSLA